MTKDTHNERIENPGAEQLALLKVPVDNGQELKTSTAHARFRLSATTRRRGLAHVAEIRRQLADAQAKREAERATPHPPRPQAA